MILTLKLDSFAPDYDDRATVRAFDESNTEVAVVTFNFNADDVCDRHSFACEYKPDALNYFQQTKVAYHCALLVDSLFDPDETQAYDEIETEV